MENEERLSFFIPHSSFFIHNCINVLIVPPEAVVIQSVTHDEIVGDVHGGIFDVEVHLQLLGLDEQGPLRSSLMPMTSLTAPVDDTPW